MFSCLREKEVRTLAGNNPQWILKTTLFLSALLCKFCTRDFVITNYCKQTFEIFKISKIYNLF